MAYPREVAQHHESTYSERLTVPWWLWPIAIAIAAVASAEIFLGAYPKINWIPYAVFIPLTVYGLIRLGGIRVSVDVPSSEPAEVRVDDAHIPLSYVTDVNVLDYAAKIELLGPAAAPNVFIVQRPWIRSAVRIVIDDPADPTPYWIVSSRRPDRLAAAINASRTAVAGQS